MRRKIDGGNHLRHTEINKRYPGPLGVAAYLSSHGAMSFSGRERMVGFLLPTLVIQKMENV